MAYLNTKEDRLNAQNQQFESLVKRGYIKSTYKGLYFFTLDESGKFNLKVFRDTSSKHIEYVAYRSEERRASRIEDFKKSYDMRLARKAEEKANPIKSTAANCSAAIKAELAKEFSNIKFSVRSNNFSGGNSVHIDWTDGPSVDDVKKFTGKYQYGHFDGMQDIYENTNCRDDIPQAKYVQEHRDMSDELRNIILPDAEKYFEGWGDSVNCRDVSQFIHMIFYKTSIPYGAIVTGLKRKDVSSGLANPDTFFAIDYTLDVPETKQAPSRPDKVDVVSGQIQVIEYSEKSIAVIGDTKPIKDKLKELGGTFNYKLSCGAGWIFPKTKLPALQQAFSN